MGLNDKPEVVWVALFMAMDDDYKYTKLCYVGYDRGDNIVATATAGRARSMGWWRRVYVERQRSWAQTHRCSTSLYDDMVARGERLREHDRRAAEPPSQAVLDSMAEVAARNALADELRTGVVQLVGSLDQLDRSERARRIAHGRGR